MIETPFPLPIDNAGLRAFLKTRRSNQAKNMSGPGPSPDQISEMLEIAARVPDHRKLAPWRFLMFQDDARIRIGEHLGRVFKAKNPDMPDDRVKFEAGRFLRAPLVIGVISSPVECARATPEWEQRLSSAIVCYNLCLAAQSFGFGAQWLTEWYAYDLEIAGAMGLTGSEKAAGFIYIGTAKDGSLPRPRPDMSSIISHY